MGTLPSDLANLVPMALPNLVTTTPPQAAIGEAFACSLYASSSAQGGSSVFCWGMNDLGQLGRNGVPYLGTQNSDFSSANILLNGALYDSPVLAVAGAQHACVVRSSNQLWCWGNYMAAGSALPLKQIIW